jgi:hypothetical protein
VNLEPGKIGGEEKEGAVTDAVRGGEQDVRVVDAVLGSPPVPDPDARWRGEEGAAAAHGVVHADVRRAIAAEVPAAEHDEAVARRRQGLVVAEKGSTGRTSRERLEVLLEGRHAGRRRVRRGEAGRRRRRPVPVLVRVPHPGLVVGVQEAEDARGSGSSSRRTKAGRRALQHEAQRTSVA